MEPGLAVGISISVIMLSALLFERLKLPNILGVLAAGILIGPFSPLAGFSFLGIQFSDIILSDPSVVGIFATIGSALILFGIGLEFSAIRLVRLGLFTFLLTLVKTGLVYLAGFAALTALGAGGETAAIVAVALSFSSTPIIVKFLESTGKIKRQETPFIISTLVVEDLLIVFFLGLISSPGAAVDAQSFLISMLRVLLTFVFVYAGLSKIVGKFLSMVSHSEELMILSTISLVLIVGYLSEGIGLSFSVGAFLAGSVIAGSSNSRKIEEKIKPFNSLFSAFFFFSIGLFVNVSEVLSNTPLLLFLAIIGILIRFLSSGIASYFAGFSGRNAIYCAITFLPVSELSLLILSQGVSSGMVPSHFIGSFASVIIASAFLSAWLSGKENRIYNLLVSLLPAFALNDIRAARPTISNVRRLFSEKTSRYSMSGMLPSISGSGESARSQEKLNVASKNAMIYLAVSIIFFSGIFLSQSPEWKFLESFYFFILLCFLISSSLFLVNFSISTNTAAKVALQSGKKKQYMAMVHFGGAAMFAILGASYIFAFYRLPPSLSIIMILPSAALGIKSIISAYRTAKGKKGF